jgi:hypothetical protein
MNQRKTIKFFKKSILFIISVVFILGLVMTSSADVGIAPSPGGGLITTGDKTDEIKMVSERVVFKIDDISNEDASKDVYNSPYNIHVTTEFKMKNLTDQTISEKLFFPFDLSGLLEWFDEDWGWSKNIKVEVNGQEVNVTHDNYVFDHRIEFSGKSSIFGVQDTVIVGVFDVNFAPNAETNIKIEYDTKSSRQPKSTLVNIPYIMETGSHWAGTIGKGEIIFDFWKDINDKLVFTDINDFFENKDGNLVWSFTDLEPDESHNIKITYDPSNLKTWLNKPEYISNIQTSNDKEGAYIYGDMRSTEQNYPGGHLDGNPINLLNTANEERGWFIEQKEDFFDEWIRFDFNDGYQLSQMKIRAGLAIDNWGQEHRVYYDTFQRPKTVTITFSDGTTQQIVLENKPDQFQTIDLINKPTNSIKLSFSDAYPGVGHGNNYFGIGRIEFVGMEKVVDEFDSEPESDPAPGIYIIISIIVLAVIAILAIYAGKSKRPKRLSKLAMFAMLLVLFGIVFADQGRLITYSFMGTGVFLAVIDIIKNLRSK